MKKYYILLSIFILLGIVTGLSLYYITISKEKSIYIESFDRQNTFELIDYPVESLQINIDDNFNNVFIRVKNNEKFIQDATKHSAYVYSFNYLHASGGYKENHLFIEDGYGYILYEDSTNKLILQPAAGIAVLDDNHLLFPYHSSGYFIDGEYNAFASLDNSVFDSFEDYKSFYQLYTSADVIIDEINQTISLIGYDYQTLRDDIFVEIMFDIDGYSVRIKEKQ